MKKDVTGTRLPPRQSVPARIGAATQQHELLPRAGMPAKLPLATTRAAPEEAVSTEAVVLFTALTEHTRLSGQVGVGRGRRERQLL